MTKSGGAIYWFGSDGKLLNSRFENNSAKLGGAIYWTAANAFIENSYFENNSALGFSGAVYILGSGSRINNSTFVDNSANYGGAISWYAVDGLLANSTFKYNHAGTGGGAILWSAIADTYSNGTIADSTFVSNVAENGDAILWANTHDQCDFIISNTNFKQKSADASLNSVLGDLSLQFSLQSNVDYSNSIKGPFIRFSTLFWNGTSFKEYSSKPTISVIGPNQNITIEIYNSAGTLLRNITGLTDSSGQITYDFRDLPDGQYTYKAYHLDNEDFPFVQDAGSFERNHIPTNLMISVTNVTYSQNAIATITASSPGTYKLVIDGKNYEDVIFTESDISNGGGISSKTVTVDLLGAKDNYEASVIYERTDRYEAASNQTRFNVYKAGSSIDVDETIGYYGEDTTIQYTVENATNANVVSIKNNSNTLVEGTDYSIVSNNDGKIVIRGLDEGTYTVTLANAVDNNHTVSSKDFTLTINPVVDLSIALAVNNQTPLYGDTIAYTITVTNNGPSVAKDIVVNYAIPAVMNVSSLDTSYVGNGIWNIASIGVGSENAATLTLYATLNNAGSFENNISVVSNEYDGNVNDNCDGITLDALPLVNLDITSTLNTASSVNIDDEITYTVNVTNNGPFDATCVEVTGISSSILKFVSAQASVGSYNSSNNIWTIDTLNADDSAILTLKFRVTSTGNIPNSFNVKSDGYDTDTSDNAVVGVNVAAKKVSTAITAKNMATKAIDIKVDGRRGQYFSVTLKDGKNHVLANKYVQIIINKVVHKVKTDKNGVAKLQINIKKAATYTVGIKFAGDSKYLASSRTVKIYVKKQIPKLASSNKSFKATTKTKKVTAVLKTSRSKALIGKKIVFTIKGKKYAAKTNKKGIAAANIKLTKKGTYACLIKYAGDTSYSAITKKIKVVIK